MPDNKTDQIIHACMYWSTSTLSIDSVRACVFTCTPAAGWLGTVVAGSGHRLKARALWRGKGRQEGEAALDRPGPCAQSSYPEAQY